MRKYATGYGYPGTQRSGILGAHSGADRNAPCDARLEPDSKPAGDATCVDSHA